MAVPVVTCPACQARLTAPDEAVGRQVRCPNCQVTVAVAAAPPAAVPDSPFDFTAPAADAERPAPRRSDGPTREPRPAARSGPPWVLLAVAAAALVGLAGVVGVVVVVVLILRVRPIDDTPEPEVAAEVRLVPRPDGKPGRVPAGWQEFRPADESFRVFLPGRPVAKSIPDGDTFTGTVYTGRVPDGTCIASVTVYQFGPRNQVTERLEVLAAPLVVPGHDKVAPVPERKTVVWLGGDRVEEVYVSRTPGGSKQFNVRRTALLNDTGYSAVLSTVEPRLAPEVEVAFFDSVVAHPRTFTPPPAAAAEPRPKAAVPAGWVAYQPPDRSWKAYFPTPPQPPPPGDPAWTKRYQSYSADGSMACYVTSLDLTLVPAVNRAGLIEWTLADLELRSGPPARRAATVAGRPALEVVFAGGPDGVRRGDQTVRVLQTATTFHVLSINSLRPGRVPAAVTNGFLDNFERNEE